MIASTTLISSEMLLLTTCKLAWMLEFKLQLVKRLQVVKITNHLPVWRAEQDLVGKVQSRLQDTFVAARSDLASDSELDCLLRFHAPPGEDHRQGVVVPD